MAGTPEGGRKAAEHQDMSEKGRKGGEALASDPKKSAASQKAAETIKRENPEHFKEIGSKGGKESGGGGRSSGSQGQGGQSGGKEEENE